jgi:hypothetical protein
VVAAPGEGTTETAAAKSGKKKKKKQADGPEAAGPRKELRRRLATRWQRRQDEEHTASKKDDPVGMGQLLLGGGSGDGGGGGVASGGRGSNETGSAGSDSKANGGNGNAPSWKSRYYSYHVENLHKAMQAVEATKAGANASIDAVVSDNAADADASEQQHSGQMEVDTSAVARAFVEGICWTFEYYYCAEEKRCPSWAWYCVCLLFSLDPCNIVML